MIESIWLIVLISNVDNDIIDTCPVVDKCKKKNILKNLLIWKLRFFCFFKRIFKIITILFNE